MICLPIIDSALIKFEGEGCYKFSCHLNAGSKHYMSVDIHTLHQYTQGEIGVVCPGWVALLTL